MTKATLCRRTLLHLLTSVVSTKRTSLIKRRLSAAGGPADGVVG